MSKVLQSTSRGQVTLPKSWREQYETKYFVAEVNGDSLVIRPLINDDFKKSVEDSWGEYKKGEFVTQEELMKKYGL